MGSKVYTRDEIIEELSQKGYSYNIEELNSFFKEKGIEAIFENESGEEFFDERALELLVAKFENENPQIKPLTFEKLSFQNPLENEIPQTETNESLTFEEPSNTEVEQIQTEAELTIQEELSLNENTVSEPIEQNISQFSSKETSLKTDDEISLQNFIQETQVFEQPEQTLSEEELPNEEISNSPLEQNISQFSSEELNSEVEIDLNAPLEIENKEEEISEIPLEIKNDILINIEPESQNIKEEPELSLNMPAFFEEQAKSEDVQTQEVSETEENKSEETESEYSFELPMSLRMLEPLETQAPSETELKSEEQLAQSLKEFAEENAQKEANEAVEENTQEQVSRPFEDFIQKTSEFTLKEDLENNEETSLKADDEISLREFDELNQISDKETFEQTDKNENEQQSPALIEIENALHNQDEQDNNKLSAFDEFNSLVYEQNQTQQTAENEEISQTSEDNILNNLPDENTATLGEIQNLLEENQTFTPEEQTAEKIEPVTSEPEENENNSFEQTESSSKETSLKTDDEISLQNFIQETKVLEQPEQTLSEEELPNEEISNSPLEQNISQMSSEELNSEVETNEPLTFEEPSNTEVEQIQTEAELTIQEELSLNENTVSEPIEQNSPQNSTSAQVEQQDLIQTPSMEEPEEDNIQSDVQTETEISTNAPFDIDAEINAQTNAEINYQLEEKNRQELAEVDDIEDIVANNVETQPVPELTQAATVPVITQTEPIPSQTADFTPRKTGILEGALSSIGQHLDIYKEQINEQEAKTSNDDEDFDDMNLLSESFEAQEKLKEYVLAQLAKKNINLDVPQQQSNSNEFKLDISENTINLVAKTLAKKIAKYVNNLISEEMITQSQYKKIQDNNTMLQKRVSDVEDQNKKLRLLLAESNKNLNSYKPTIFGFYRKIKFKK